MQKTNRTYHFQLKMPKILLDIWSEGPDIKLHGASGNTWQFYYEFTMKIQPREGEALTRVDFHSKLIVAKILISGLRPDIRGFWPRA